MDRMLKNFGLMFILGAMSITSILVFLSAAGEEPFVASPGMMRSTTSASAQP